MSLEATFYPDGVNLIVDFAYSLEGYPGKIYKKRLSINQSRIVIEKNLIPTKQIEMYIKFLIEKKGITAEFIHYNNLKYLNQLIRSSLKIINSDRRSKAQDQFREYANGYNKRLVMNEPDKFMKGKFEAELEDVSRWDKRGFFTPGDTGISSLVLGASFTGKTYFLVDQLNKLNPLDYDMILLFTESKNAEPLKDLREDLKVQIYEGFKGGKVSFLKKINDLTDNRYRFLVILDDVVDQKMAKVLQKMVLTYRNACISTCVLLQYPFLVSKAMRGSFHKVVITGFKSLEDWEGVSKVYDLTEWARERMMDSGEKELSKKNTMVYKYLKKLCKPKGDIIFIDNKHSKDPVVVHTNGRRREG